MIQGVRLLARYYRYSRELRGNFFGVAREGEVFAGDLVGVVFLALILSYKHNK